MCSWQKGASSMESIFLVHIPVQMISCTDTNGKITPMRFRFQDSTGEIITVLIDKILTREQSKMTSRYICSATVHGMTKEFCLWYSYMSHDWHMSWMQA
jgi:hypothetical protein